MITKKRKSRRFRGFSLIDAMVTIAILIIAVIGTANYRYYAALDLRRANMRSTASRIGLLLCESWRGLEGKETYDPITHVGTELIISNSSGPDAPDGFNSLGSYLVTENDTNYYTTLSYQDDVTGDLRTLNIIVAWSQKKQDSQLDEVDKSFRLTTYALR